MTRERRLRFVGEVLIVKYEHAEPVHAFLDLGSLIARQRLGDVHSGRDAGEERTGYRIGRTDGQRHGRTSLPR
jgi:hypothetical protein